MTRPTAGKRAVRRRYAILGVLVDIGPANATAIADKLARNGGAIYADLAWMESEGLIVGEWERAADDRPRRRLYRIATDDERGRRRRIRREVDQEIADRVAARTPPWRRIPILRPGGGAT